jgi:hypothetical protein
MLPRTCAIAVLAVALVVVATTVAGAAPPNAPPRKDEPVTTNNVPYNTWHNAVRVLGLDRAVHLFAPEQPGAAKRCAVERNASHADRPGHGGGASCFRVRLTREGDCCWLSRRGESPSSTFNENAMFALPQFRGLLPVSCCFQDTEAFNQAECLMAFGKICELLDASDQGAPEKENEDPDM